MPHLWRAPPALSSRRLLRRCQPTISPGWWRRAGVDDDVDLGVTALEETSTPSSTSPPPGSRASAEHCPDAVRRQQPLGRFLQATAAHQPSPPSSSITTSVPTPSPTPAASASTPLDATRTPAPWRRRRRGRGRPLRRHHPRRRAQAGPAIWRRRLRKIVFYPPGLLFTFAYIAAGAIVVSRHWSPHRCATHLCAFVGAAKK